MTLFEMKEKIFALDSEIKTISDYIMEKSADPTTPIEDIREKKAKMEELRERRDTLKAQHDLEEENQRKALAFKQGGGAGTGMTEKDVRRKAKADFYRTVLTGGDIRKAYEGLGGIPAATADLGNGEHLLPTNISHDLVMEPVENNPLRSIVRVTNISGLEEPKLGFTIEDADIGDVTDQQTANEIAMEGDIITYGRLKMKVSATVKDTVLHGTETDLISAIETNLRGGLAKREKMYAFLPAASCATDATHAHMSFYQTTTSGGETVSAIKEVTGTSLYDAIVNAIADLDDDFSANARIVMKKTDYFSIVKDLSNNSDVLFTDKPASILGIPVTFCDKATVPVVGDFSYYGINYDIGAIYETDKDAKKGEYYFVLTAWGDQQIRLKSAFRLAKVGE